MTNLEKIRSMSVEELARFLCEFSGCYRGNGSRCDHYDLCMTGGDVADSIASWLESEVEE